MSMLERIYIKNRGASVFTLRVSIMIALSSFSALRTPFTIVLAVSSENIFASSIASFILTFSGITSRLKYNISYAAIMIGSRFPTGIVAMSNFGAYLWIKVRSSGSFSITQKKVDWKYGISREVVVMGSKNASRNADSSKCTQLIERAYSAWRR